MAEVDIGALRQAVIDKHETLQAFFNDYEISPGAWQKWMKSGIIPDERLRSIATNIGQNHVSFLRHVKQIDSRKFLNLYDRVVDSLTERGEIDYRVAVVVTAKLHNITDKLKEGVSDEIISEFIDLACQTPISGIISREESRK